MAEWVVELPLQRMSVWRWALVLPLALACSSGGNANVAGANPDAQYDVPVRMVVGDLPDGFFSGSPTDAGRSGTTGSVPIASGDAFNDVAMVATPDALGPLPGPFVDAASGCNLLQQNCRLGYGCYPAKGGQGQCMAENGDFPAQSPCIDHDQCLPGLVCVEALGGGSSLACEPLCDPLAGTPCPGGGICTALPGTDVGFCRP